VEAPIHKSGRRVVYKEVERKQGQNEFKDRNPLSQKTLRSEHVKDNAS
jgi:hypothetical protein